MSPQGPSPHSRDQTPRVHAVVWRSPGTPIPEDLVSALARQGIQWTDSTGPFDAFSRLLTLPSRRPGSPGRVLLLVEPDALPAADELRHALDRFDPATVCWGYQPGAHPRLAPLPPIDKPAEPEIVVRQTPKSSNGIHLRLTGSRPDARPIPNQIPNQDHDPEHTPAAADEPVEPETPRSVLTPEELEMLLADDPQ